MTEVVHGSPQTVWAQIVDSDTVYVGSIVTASDEGVKPLAAASGSADCTNRQVVYGVCIGTNNRPDVYDTTYMTQKIVDATPAADDTDFMPLGDGPHPTFPKGVRMAKVAIVTPSTVLKMPIWNGAVGTALTTGTITTDGASSCTVNSLGFADAGVKSTYETVYFRTGRYTGEYRVLDSRSSISLTWDKSLYSSTATGDTLVVATGLRPNGPARLTILAEGTGADGAGSNSADWFAVNVVRLDLTETGKEYVEFCFQPSHFNDYRTTKIG
jgi:hypothetical protein